MSDWFRSSAFVSLTIAIVLSVYAHCSASEDWPMWRCDANRSAAAPDNALPAEFKPLWTRSFSERKQAWDDPLNQDLMTYDRLFEPIVMDGRLFVSFNDRDKVVAFDTKTGDELWAAYADGPVRLPPVASEGRVYFSSDDGFLYCVDAATGQQHWKFSGAPNSQQAIGNGRIISAWPARGGPVLRDGTVYFAASIWPFMGTFIFALNAETGEVEWVNDSTGSQYIKQPHSAPSFAGVAPQGAFVATRDTLLVPGGRSVPAAFDRSNGKLRYFEINAGGKGTGGSFLSADETNFYVHTRYKGTRAFNLKTGVKTAFMPSEPVLHNGMIYAAEMDGKKNVVRAYGIDEKQKWQIEADGSGDLILAGGHLVAAGKDGITIIQLGTASGEVVNSIATGQKFERLICADAKLFGVTAQGQMTAFGADKPISAKGSGTPTEPKIAQRDRQAIRQLLDAGDAEGYAMWIGACDSSLARALYAESPFEELAVYDVAADAVHQTRRELDAHGVYGRITVHESDAESLRPPKHVANMMFVDAQVLGGSSLSTIVKLYESVRPYGGVLHLLAANENRLVLKNQVSSMDLEQATIEVGEHGLIIRRVGALPGSGDWTHQHGDVANTIKSDDSRVKLPLGILWFGGSSNMDVLPRHGHGPPEQVIGGRLFIQGMNSLSCRDVYTGRVIWKREFENLGTFDVYYDTTYDNTPLDPKYNQVHIPGANGRGTNFVATEDRVYILEGSVCHVLDPATGKNLTDITIPGARNGEEWGYIGVYKNVLLGGTGFANYQQRKGVTLDSDEKLKSSRAGFGTKSFDRAASMALTAFDRHSGKVLWTVNANHSFWHNGIVAGGGRIYCLDRNPPQLEELLRRRGLLNADTYRVLALDALSGNRLWEIKDDVFGTWLSYSDEHDALLQAGASGSDRLAGEVSKGMAVYSAATGDVVWKNESLRYTGPCILHNDLIITNTNSYAESAGAFFLKTGKQKLVPNPLTGEPQPWKLTRAYGCNNIIASENMLTFRSGAAGYYDLKSNAGTGNLGGFKSGCTSNLVVAGGVLNAPDYTRTCSCAYQNQTSLALVHMPDVETWSVNSAASVKTKNDRIERLGLNFGAPGDRRDPNGLLWLEYPATAGPSPLVSIRFNRDATFFQNHSSVLPNTSMSWVLSSGADNVTDVRIGLNLQRSDLKSGIPISRANDDAEEDENGEVDVSSSDLELIDDDGSQLVGLRFNAIPLDQNTRIRNAWIQFTCDEVSKGDSSLIIAAEDTDDAKEFKAEKHDLSSRTLTRQEVGWKPKEWPKKGAADALHRTPNLAKLVEAVISRKDWKPGNSLAFLISGSGKRTASAWKKGTKQSARLIVESDETAVIPTSKPAATFRLKLYFAAPRFKAGKRVFDVVVQGGYPGKQLTLESANDKRTAVLPLDDVSIADELHIQLIPKVGKPVLSGIEISRMDTKLSP